jgi:hypothetical protein
MILRRGNVPGTFRHLQKQLLDQFEVIGVIIYEENFFLLG